MHKFSPKDLEKLDNPSRREAMPPLETLKKFGVSDSGVFIDIGCGSGYFSIAAAELLKNGSVIGLDIMDEMLEVASTKTKGLNNIGFKKCEEYSFPVEKGSADYALMCNVLHEVEDKQKYLLEAIRILKPDGVLYVIEWVKEPMKMGPPVKERISVEELLNLGLLTGFNISEKIEINSNHYGLKLRRV